MNATQRLALLVFAAVLAALAGCETTQITSVWRDEDLARVAFRKVLVAFQHPDRGLREAAERRMAADIANAVPAHAILSHEEVRDIDIVKARVREHGFDSAIVMRLEAVDREVSYVPGRVYAVPGWYHGFYGYWGHGWRMVHDPGYYRTSRVVHMATNVYSVADDKLVWSSRSETFNPASLPHAAEEVLRVTSRATGEILKARG
jgi:hypothetical protein